LFNHFMKRTAMTRRLFLSTTLVVAATATLPTLIAGMSTPAMAQSNVLNLYTARHYSSDDALYAKFTAKTGIKVNVVSSSDEPLLERIRSEGAASPADVILLVDATRLWRAQQEGLFQPLKSAVLDKAIPTDRRGGDAWVGLTTRERVLIIDPTRVKPEQVSTYASLADPSLKGLVCSRTASHPYMLSLIGSQLAKHGSEKTEAWMRGVIANLARPSKGGDTDQIRAVASGECGVAISNSYYYARLMRSDKPEDKAAVAKTRLVWPDQKGDGTHLNISGGGIAKHAQNAANARAFLEFLASPEIQGQFAMANNERPVVAKVPYDNPALTSLGTFKADPMPVEKFASQSRLAQQLVDKTGWR
jgi:iron(III) transport system substrate-binding protein